MNKLLTYKLALIALAAILLFSVSGNASDKESCSEVKFKTSASNWESKNVIESNLNSLIGVIDSDLDLVRHVLKVRYDNSKINCDSIIKAIKKLGYDAEQICKDALDKNSSKERQSSKDKNIVPKS